MNITIEQASFRCSVCGLNERFPTTTLKQTQSNTEGDGETLLCEVASQDLCVAMTATVDPLASTSQCLLLTHGSGVL